MEKGSAIKETISSEGPHELMWKRPERWWSLDWAEMEPRWEKRGKPEHASESLWPWLWGTGQRRNRKQRERTEQREPLMDDGRWSRWKGMECVYLLVQCDWGAWSLLGAGRAGVCLCGWECACVCACGCACGLAGGLEEPEEPCEGE